MNSRGVMGMRLAGAAAIACGLWLLARELRRHAGRSPGAAAPDNRFHGPPASARRRTRATGTGHPGLDWDKVDEAAAQSFPASDPPGFNPLSI